MDNDKLVLKDGTEINLGSSQGMGMLHTRVDSVKAACTLWEKLTPENLEQVKVKNAAGLTVGRYSDMVLDHVEARDTSDGAVMFTISLREKNAVEILAKRVDAVEAGQEIQDGAIDEMGQVMSDIVGGGTQ